MMDHIPDRSPERELARLRSCGRSARAGTEAAVARLCRGPRRRLRRPRRPPSGGGRPAASLLAFLAAQARFTPPGASVAIAAVAPWRSAGTGVK
ncbi:MAG: hypothetical protein ACLTSX_00015 [Collinsella sp.]